MRDDVALFIITHQRADKQLTLNTLKALEYSGKIYLVVDNKDDQLSLYQKKYGEMVLTFDKEDYAKDVDTHINRFDMQSALFARNACIDFARKLGVAYYFVCDDDISRIKVKDARSGKMDSQYIKKITPVLEALVGYMEKTIISALGIIYEGAYVGGINGIVKNGVKYEVCQFVLYRASDPVRYESIMWEDTASCCRDLGLGKIEFSPMFLSTLTPKNGSNSGGAHSMYEKSTDYVNAFFILMERPDCVKITMHKGAWKMRISQNALRPLIINENYRKQEAFV